MRREQPTAGRRIQRQAPTARVLSRLTPSRTRRRRALEGTVPAGQAPSQCLLCRKAHTHVSAEIPRGETGCARHLDRQGRLMVRDDRRRGICWRYRRWDQRPGPRVSMSASRQGQAST
eukprot:717002-Rhodomonas_salina.1